MPVISTPLHSFLNKKLHIKAVHRTNKLKYVFCDTIDVPAFGYDEFTSMRFGVFWGKSKKIKITIDKENNIRFNHKRDKA